MKTVAVSPATFDGAKFAARYSLTRNDFEIRGNLLYFPDSLPDAPTLEAPDAPPANPKPAAAITALRAGTATAAEVRDILRWILLRDGVK